MKYKTCCELLGQQTKNDVFQQPTEVVISESLQKREESRAALCTPSMHRPKKQGWGLGSGDGAGMELADRLPVDKAKALSSVEKNCSTSAVMSPGESFVTAVALGQKWNTQKLDRKSNHETEYFQSSTPFTKPPNPMLTDQPELPIPTSSTMGADCKRSSSQHYSHSLQPLSENPNPRSKLDSPLYVDLLLDEGNDRQGKHFIRNTQKPKSILLEPHNKIVKVGLLLFPLLLLLQAFSSLVFQSPEGLNIQFLFCFFVELKGNLFLQGERLAGMDMYGDVSKVTGQRGGG